MKPRHIDVTDILACRILSDGPPRAWFDFADQHRNDSRGAGYTARELGVNLDGHVSFTTPQGGWVRVRAVDDVIKALVAKHKARLLDHSTRVINKQPLDGEVWTVP